MALKVIMFLGSVREGRLVERVSKFMQAQLQASGFEVEIFDPKEMPFDMVKKPLHFHRDQKEAPEWLQAAGKKIAEADAFTVISGEYNCTIPPALTNMMDHFPPSSFSFRPTLIVTYSPSMLGGARAGVALRPFLAELSTVAVPSSLSIPKAQEAIDDAGKCLNDHTASSAAKNVKNLHWYATALTNQRKVAGAP